MPFIPFALSWAMGFVRLTHFMYSPINLFVVARSNGRTKSYKRSRKCQIYSPFSWWDDRIEIQTTYNLIFAKGVRANQL